MNKLFSFWVILFGKVYDVEEAKGLFESEDRVVDYSEGSKSLCPVQSFAVVIE